MMCGMLNNILDDLYNLHVYYSQVECICQYWMCMYRCYIITYATLHNIVGVTVNHHNFCSKAFQDVIFITKQSLGDADGLSGIRYSSKIR